MVIDICITLKMTFPMAFTFLLLYMYAATYSHVANTEKHTFKTVYVDLSFDIILMAVSPEHSGPSVLYL